MENSSMVKIGPVGSVTLGSVNLGSVNLGNIWDEKGRTEIVQIFVSHDTKIYSLQFLYANDKGELVLSDRHGHKTAGDNFNIVDLNYPSEYIISVSASDKEFMLHLGSKRQFGGFHGTADGYIIRSIGMYVKPISNLESSKEKSQANPKSRLFEGKRCA